jgi:hypothetical protein
MVNEKILENYLVGLEAQLKDLPVATKAKIIVQFNEKIQQLHQTNNHLTTDQILNDLGSVESVANHYRLDNNLATIKTPITSKSWFKLTTIFLVLPLFFISITFVWLIWKFTPILKIDEDNQRVVILGGLIDIDSKGGKIKIGDDYKFSDAKYSNTFEGAIEINSEITEDLEINFASGKLELLNSDSTKLSWNCRLEQDPGKDLINEQDDVVQLDFYKFGSSDCKIYIPSKMKVSVEGENGNIFVEEAEYDIFVQLVNGLVVVNPNPEILYKYDLKSDNGTVATFDKSDSADAFEVRIHIKNGNIENK